MGPINTGQTGCWRTIFAIALLGMFALGYVVVKAIIWIANHVSISW